MEFLAALWLPILLSAVAVWFVSMIASMALPHHKQDWIDIPTDQGGEDGLMDYLRKSGIEPGNYLFPDFRSPEGMKTPKVENALSEGPVGHLSVWKTPVTMADKLIGTFFVHFAVATIIACLARTAFPATAPFATIFHFTALAGVLAYCFAPIPSALWWGTYKRTIVANIIDGIVYGAIIGAIFAWRWPH